MNKPLILAVDDEKDFLEIASTLLESLGFSTAVMPMPKEAELIERCEYLRPDLILLDVDSPEGAVGLSLASAIKSNLKTASVKVILWSAVPLSEPSMADDFFNKSEDLSVLVNKIRFHLPSINI